MARGRKSRASEWSQPPKLQPDTFHRFIRTVSAAKQKLSDANMAHAGEWKKAEPLGIHPQAAKLYCRLDDMEETKRRDFLRAFDQYREWADWRAQPDMFDDQPDAGDRPPVELVEAPLIGEDEREDADRTEAERPATAEDAAAGDVEADGVEDEAAADQLAGAGFVFADGKAAALDGRPVDDNPHPADAPTHSIWSRGHAQGLRDKEAGERAEAAVSTSDDEATPPTRRRGRPRAESEASALVH